ncbi:unnamed protein product [Effrenium voratum]|nr:unnamed protein product [Effrenium voratum]
MAGEYPMLKSFGVDSIEAYDTAEGMYQKFLEFQPNPEIPVTYHVMDVNEIHLEEGAFDVIYIQHAYHHFERIEHVAEEISKALKPSGVFVITDWIGPNFLQRTPAQLAVMNNLWHHMPAKWRTDHMGIVHSEPVVPAKESLSPFEAVRSQEIKDVLDARFEKRMQCVYAGILYPMFEGRGGVMRTAKRTGWWTSRMPSAGVAEPNLFSESQVMLEQLAVPTAERMEW